jgi:hypothetical protein
MKHNILENITHETQRTGEHNTCNTTYWRIYHMQHKVLENMTRIGEHKHTTKVLEYITSTSHKPIYTLQCGN